LSAVLNKIILLCFYKEKKKVDLENESKKKEEELGVAEWEKKEHRWINNQMLYLRNENFQLEPCVPLKTIKSEEGLQSEIMELRNKLKISECKGVQVDQEIAQCNQEII
jgi:hypothetical protein